MTERKPREMPVSSWVEHQIRRAQAEGAFENLPGTGKPIPDLLKPETELDLVAKIARRENLDVTAFLPPALALAKEAEDLPVTLARLPTEAKVRAHVDDLNERIRVERLKPVFGPPVRTPLIDVDQAVADWQAARPVAPAAPAVPPPAPKRWWRR